MQSRFKVPAVLAAMLMMGAVQAAPVSGQGTWETTLKARDINGNAVALDSVSAAFFYDSTLNVTWLANMNQNGPMNWYEATAWATALDTGGFTDWRLPTIIDSGTPGCTAWTNSGGDCGYNVQTEVNGAYSELAHLYYVTLGNLAYTDPNGNAGQPGWGLTNTAHFQDMQANGYWSRNLYQVSAWRFNISEGSQSTDSVGQQGMSAVAVRSGDIAAPVPEPATIALAAVALLGITATRRRRPVAPTA